MTQVALAKKNKNGYVPHEIAKLNGHTHLTDYLKQASEELLSGTLYRVTIFISTTQWVFGAKITSYRRRCDVITSVNTTSFLRHVSAG